MIQLWGQSAPSVASDADGPAPATRVRAFATPRTADRALFHLDLRRSLAMHWRLALAVVLAVSALATLYLLDDAMPLKQRPAFQSASTVELRPAPTMIVPKEGASQELPFDSNAIETYLQQQMASVKRTDVLLAALHNLTGFQRAGESGQAAVQRLESALEVTREGPAYRFLIAAHAETPEMAAQIANAVTAAYIAGPARDVPTTGSQHVQMWNQERDRIQSALAADQSEQKALIARLQKLGDAAPSDTGGVQRLSDLSANIALLQARNAKVDDQLHDPKFEDAAPMVTYQVTPAVPPPGSRQSVVLRNPLMIPFAALFLGVLAAVSVNKLDPRVYIGADVERVLGFAPLAQLPDFNEVSYGAAEEYTLRLASAIEQGRTQDNLKNCIFTGTGPETGVSTLVSRVTEILETMGSRTVLVDATGTPEPAQLHELTGARKTADDSLVVTDTAPLAVSAETEYLARFADCAIVVIASGVTTRSELRETARTLERLKVSAVGFVLNRVGLKKADAAFRTSIEGVERHLRIYGKSAAIRNEKRASSTLVQAATPEVISLPPSTGWPSEPELPPASVPQISAPAQADAVETVVAVQPSPEPSPLPAAQAEPSEPIAATAPQAHPEAAAELTPEKAASEPEYEVPSWLMESMRRREPMNLPAPSERLWTAQRPPTDALIEAAAQSLNLDTQKFREAFEQWRDQSPNRKETLRAASGPGEARKPDIDEADVHLNSRLKAIKSLLFVLGAKDAQSGDETGGHLNGGSASPGMVTAVAELISARELAIELEEGDAPVRVGDVVGSADRGR